MTNAQTHDVTRDDERRAIRLVLAMATGDNPAAAVVLTEAVDLGRHSHLLVAVARYAADLSRRAMPDVEDQLQAVLLGMAVQDVTIEPEPAPEDTVPDQQLRAWPPMTLPDVPEVEDHDEEDGGGR